ncbi:hypothetical protein THAOC_33969, partial [Thalassiosira oceanica]
MHPQDTDTLGYTRVHSRALASECRGMRPPERYSFELGLLKLDASSLSGTANKYTLLPPLHHPAPNRALDLRSAPPLPSPAHFPSHGRRGDVRARRAVVRRDRQAVEPLEVHLERGARPVGPAAERPASSSSPRPTPRRREDARLE